MRGFFLLLAGVCLAVLAECRIEHQEVFVPALVPQLQHHRVRRQAPSVNVHKIPKTSFTCDGRTAGEYYADVETKCQVYRVCIEGLRGKMTLMSFACPNGTIFNQATRACTPFDRVDCALASRFYETVHGDPNFHLKDVTEPPRTVVLREQLRSTGRQTQGRAPTRNTRPVTETTTEEPIPRVTRPPIFRGTPPSVFRGPPAISTSTSAYEYDYEYEYEDEEKKERSKREANDPLGLLSFDWSRSTVMTGFSCDDKVTGAFYADTEANCEMIHVCVPVAKKKLIDHKLFCAKGKAYNQQTGYCEKKGTFDCPSATKYYKYDKMQSFFVGKPVITEKKILEKTKGILKKY